MRDCLKYQDMIENYLDNTLDENELKKFEKHIKTCSSCNEELEFAKSLRSALKNIEFPDAPDDLLARVNYELDAEFFASQKPGKFRFFNRRTFSAIAACLLIISFIGINNKQNLTDNITPQVTQSPTVNDRVLSPAVIQQDSDTTTENADKSKPKSVSVPKQNTTKIDNSQSSVQKKAGTVTTSTSSSASTSNNTASTEKAPRSVPKSNSAVTTAETPSQQPFSMARSSGGGGSSAYSPDKEEDKEKEEDDEEASENNEDETSSVLPEDNSNSSKDTPSSDNNSASANTEQTTSESTVNDAQSDIN